MNSLNSLGFKELLFGIWERIKMSAIPENAAEYIYLIHSRAGTRSLGGTTGYIPDTAAYVRYHRCYPCIEISFSEFATGMCSRINRRNSVKTGLARTWQTTLPVTKLGIPERLYFGQAETAITPIFDEGGKTIIDLSRLVVTGERPESRAFREASNLISKLGILLGKYPNLQDKISHELGVRLVVLDDENDQHP